MDKITKRILVTGFPHCGTTILRAKIGECESVFDQHYEFGDPANYNANSGYDWFVWKHPFLHTVFRNGGFKIKPNTEFKDEIIIPIIRNPWYVFTSLKKRGEKNNEFDINDNRQGHSLDYFFNAAEVFLDALKNNYKNVYPIKYEDMFVDNFKNLKEIFNKIGLKYSDDIFKKRTKTYLHNNNDYISDLNELEKKNGDIRVWQINQPFQNMNFKVDIPEEFSNRLSDSPLIKELGYTNPHIIN